MVKPYIDHICFKRNENEKIKFINKANPKIAKPGECCTESFIVLGAFDTKQNYVFVPDLGTYNTEITDKDLCKRWGITKDEWEYIDSRICNIKGHIANENIAVAKDVKCGI